ncbi:ABC transporter ATP-binding protein [Jiella sp. MQZ9-1]|uniref:ABC transporter ATP-binding protein n=1 Tax=Jiella flava TaxID=2816857 RepID=A0A939G1R8_9HYPH|nr:ABC transporter ATP-binding protein [Jiella flava]MBO0664211.1 ABC transporter ATP-binding protein [Jiella flava]MCD2472857.1 ABC transporter ATP-binding protein [Jiella flava]
MAQIAFEQVSKSWGETEVLRPMDLSIANGECVAILGPSGCGKSTTLFLLAGLYAPTSGKVLFDGHVVNGVDARDRNVGIVFQSYALYPHMTVRANIGFPLRFQKVDKDDLSRRVVEAANLVQIDEFLDRKPAELSGGQQQRVALARALVKQPNILLLDEPLSNLDATLRMSMRAEIRAIQRRLGMTTLIVTHDQIEAMTMADRIICMSRGAVAQIGTPDELYRRPADTFVAGFIGSPPITLLEGDAKGETLHIGTGAMTLTASTAGRITLGLRPEDLRLGAPGQGGLPARVVTVEPLGREVLYGVETAIGRLHVLAMAGDAVPPAGEPAAVQIDAAHSLLFDAGGRRIPNLNIRP